MADNGYEQYLARFTQAFGEVEVGAFVKHKGQLVPKLSFEEFLEEQRTFDELFETYSGVLERGDTINDMIVRLLRSHAAKLMRIDPVEL